MEVDDRLETTQEKLPVEIYNSEDISVMNRNVSLFKGTGIYIKPAKASKQIPGSSPNVQGINFASSTHFSKLHVKTS